MQRQYPISRDVVLRSGYWNSCMRRALLAASTVAPAWGFARAFPLPSDCLLVATIEPDDLVGERWRVEGREILTDAAGPLRVRYVARVEDVGQFDPLLADAIAFRLAADTAQSVAGSASLAAAMEAQYRDVLRRAAAMDAREQSQDDTMSATTWLDARVSLIGY